VIRRGALGNESFAAISLFVLPGQQHEDIELPGVSPPGGEGRTAEDWSSAIFTPSGGMPWRSASLAPSRGEQRHGPRPRAVGRPGGRGLVVADPSQLRTVLAALQSRSAARNGDSAIEIARRVGDAGELRLDECQAPSTEDNRAPAIGMQHPGKLLVALASSGRVSTNCGNEAQAGGRTKAPFGGGAGESSRHAQLSLPDRATCRPANPAYQWNDRRHRRVLACLACLRLHGQLLDVASEVGFPDRRIASLVFEASSVGKEEGSLGPNARPRSPKSRAPRQSPLAIRYL